MPRGDDHFTAAVRRAMPGEARVPILAARQLAYWLRYAIHYFRARPRRRYHEARFRHHISRAAISSIFIEARFSFDVAATPIIGLQF